MFSKISFFKSHFISAFYFFKSGAHLIEPKTLVGMYLDNQHKFYNDPESWKSKSCRLFIGPACLPLLTLLVMWPWSTFWRYMRGQCIDLPHIQRQQPACQLRTISTLFLIDMYSWNSFKSDSTEFHYLFIKTNYHRCCKRISKILQRAA